jgi:uncharacterized protein YjdB
MAAFALACVAGATCADQSSSTPSGPVAPGHARLSVSPSFQALPSGGPQIKLSRARGLLIGVNGDTTVVEANFVDGTAVLTFEVSFPGPSATYTLDLTEYDTEGRIAFHAVQQYTLHQGNNPNLPQPVLVYAAPDAGVTVLQVTPDHLILNAGSTGTLSVSGTNPGGSTVPRPRVGWSSSSPDVASVDADGVVHAGQFQGTTTITAQMATGVSASVPVQVHAPVDHVTIAPATLDVVRGLSGAAAAELRDAGGHLIDDRAPTWTTSNAAVATVSSFGVIQGIKIGTATITATAEGKSASLEVHVVSPVDHIQLASTSLNFASLNETHSLDAQIVAKNGASVDGIAITYASSDPSVATVSGDGTVTAKHEGSATITASAEGVQASATATVHQVATSITISPKTAGVTALGATQPFTATAKDALGSPLLPTSISWSSSNTAVATVGADGVAVATGTGQATITASAGDKSDAATFTVSQVPRLLFINTDLASIAVGESAHLSARTADANGNTIGPTNPTWGATPKGLVTISGNTVTGVEPGTVQITATLGDLTARLNIEVTGSGSGEGAALTISPATVEKLPRGTQLFTVVDGGAGPYVWSVNGTDGGDATYGTIDSEGYYVAPARVPQPATFDVCARRSASPADHGCAKVTINPIPTSGADVIVFNDLNVFNGPGDSDPNNQTMFVNLVNFTGSGARASQHSVMFFFGHNSNGNFGYPTMRNVLAMAGYTVDDVTADLVAPIAAKYKVLFLWLPQMDFSVAEINNLKAFSAEGGRIVFVGEYAGFYGGGIGIENAFFAAMGAQMTNSGGAYDCGYAVEPFSSIRPHQVMTGVTQLTVACASEIIPGPNDYPFLYDATGTRVLAAAAKVDVTPLVVSSERRQARTIRRPAPRPNSTVVGPRRDPKDPAGRPLPP